MFDIHTLRQMLHIFCAYSYMHYEDGYILSEISYLFMGDSYNEPHIHIQFVDQRHVFIINKALL